MSCIHYQFKSAMDYKTLTFEGLSISVMDLKAEIMEREKISATNFDLQLTNAQTKVPYTDESTLIPRNSSVIVARIPAKDPVKLPKIQENAKLMGVPSTRLGPTKVKPSQDSSPPLVHKRPQGLDGLDGSLKSLERDLRTMQENESLCTIS